MRLESVPRERIELIIHRIHKWRTREKKLVPSHESEALEDKKKLQIENSVNLQSV